MAACLSVAIHETALLVFNSSVRLCLRQRTGLFTPHRCSHGARSSLYEHVREGYSDKPELDMTAVCEETDKVVANVESRKGDLRGDDVRKMVRGFTDDGEIAFRLISPNIGVMTRPRHRCVCGRSSKL